MIRKGATRGAHALQKNRRSKFGSAGGPHLLRIRSTSLWLLLLHSAREVGNKNTGRAESDGVIRSFTCESARGVVVCITVSRRACRFERHRILGWRAGGWSTKRSGATVLGRVERIARTVATNQHTFCEKLHNITNTHIQNDSTFLQLSPLKCLFTEVKSGNSFIYKIYPESQENWNFCTGCEFFTSPSSRSDHEAQRASCLWIGDVFMATIVIDPTTVVSRTESSIVTDTEIYASETTAMT